MNKNVLAILPIAIFATIIFTWLFSKQPAFRKKREALIANQLNGIYVSSKDIKRGDVIIYVRTDTGTVEVYLSGYMQYMERLQKADSLHKDAGSGTIEIYRKDASGVFQFSSTFPPLK